MVDKFEWMKIKIVILVIVFFNVHYLMTAQQEPQYSQNMFNILSINPGIAGHGEGICITAIHREQWMGFKSEVGEGESKEKVRVSPRTSHISANIPLKFLHGGIGANIVQDNIGFEKNIGLDLGYAYQTNLNYGKIGIGFQVGFLNKTINFSQFSAIDENDPLLQGQKEEKAMYMDFALGTYYSDDNKYLGISTSQILESSAEIGSAEPKLKRHFYFTGGYHFKLKNAPQFQITPSAFIKSDIASTQIDLNGLVDYKNKFWGGMSYRITDAVVLMGGFKFEKYKVGAAYDIPTSAISHAGSLELMFNYCFSVETDKLPEIYRNVRFL